MQVYTYLYKEEYIGKHTLTQIPNLPQFIFLRRYNFFQCDVVCFHLENEENVKEMKNLEFSTEL